MFERYSESARRALFFARYEVTQLGGVTIEPEHLVLGVLRAAPEAILRFARGGHTATSLRQAFETGLAAADRVSVSVEIPFSAETKDALQRTAVEADDLKNPWIRPEHIVLGVLVTTYGDAARVLREAGVDVAAIREHLATTPETPHDAPPPSRLPAPGMVSRQWTGVVKPGKADEYVAHLRRETLPALERIAGYVTAGILRREVEDGTEFQVVTLWRSLDDITAFAGEDVTRAVVPPAAQALLVRYDDRAVHYQIVRTA